MQPFRALVTYQINGAFKNLVVVIVAHTEENAAYVLNQYLLSISIGDYIANIDKLKGAGIHEGQDFGNT